MRDPRYDILVEPVTIGPVTAPNRFYQVPHCSGMGRARPRTLAAMRGMKAEGGWGVVCTEYCSMHPSSDDAGFPFATLWDNDDIRVHALMTEAVHEHGALAGVELWHGGGSVANLDTRIAPIGLQSRPAAGGIHPVQSRRLNRRDIDDIKRWQGDAAKRAVNAGFDIVYVYATHGYLLSTFLDGQINQRQDEYGGALENRVRLVRELIEITLESVAGKAAVATRFSVDLASSESYDAFAMLAELPDLWDLTVNDYDVEMAPSRFGREAALADHVAKARALTTKPVVAVGRYTSPDTMVSVIKQGKQDLIGAARPSIADPFLPKKIIEGRLDDIRECIGCNLCYAHDSLGVPVRCTQNPTFGEEWRRGWHPEKLGSPSATVSTTTGEAPKALVVGAGPAGLEAARVLGERGFEVMLADGRTEAGGRVSLESRLPGLAEWGRVRDWRMTRINKMSNVGFYPDSQLSAADVRQIDADYVLLATGSKWRTDGTGRARQSAFAGYERDNVVSADLLLQQDAVDPGHYLIFDDDHYYLSTVLALKLRATGAQVTIACSQGQVCSWGRYTNEQHVSNVELYRSGVTVLTNQVLERVDHASATVRCIYSDRETRLAVDWVVPLTCREPDNTLETRLVHDVPDVTDGTSGNIHAIIGDCSAPGTIAAAVYSGYKAGLACGLQDKPSLVRRDMPLI